MPTLNWIGKEKVINHHQDVPYKILEPQYGFANGVQQTEPNDSGNKIIHGDNLEALKSLLPEYEGKIKCIYIDPPYNTGNESWVYNDNVNHPKIKKWLGEVVGKDGEDLTRHDKWLCMMYPRLKLLHKLLAKDGAIFISIDDNEQAHLKLLCDEIFGNGNFVANVIWQKKYTQSNDAKYFSNTHDFILCYSKQKENFEIGLFPRNENQTKAYKNPDNDIKGPWKATPLTVKTPSESYIYQIETPSGRKVSPPIGRSWMYSYEKFQKDIADNKIWFGFDGKNVPSKKSYLSEVKQGVTPKTIWLYDEAGHNHEANQEIKNILPYDTFDSPKPSRLIELILKVAKADKNSIILDSFAGSGTTAHAVLNLNKQDGGNRKFILIEMEDYANTITAERVKRVISPPTPEGRAKSREPLGGSFDYYELGEPLFLEEDILNEAVGIENILKYIWYSETRTPFTPPLEGLGETNYRIGSKDQTDYYFYYIKDAVTTVDYDFMAKIKHKASQYIIYADNCLLEKDFMLKHHIIFKKIPRDITRF
jgi:adenine-specific DNA-methyltransferase